MAHRAPNTPKAPKTPKGVHNSELQWVGFLAFPTNIRLVYRCVTDAIDKQTSLIQNGITATVKFLQGKAFLLIIFSV